jgi:hypothetical protein
LGSLESGEELRVALELNNPVTGPGVQIQTTDCQLIGWEPHYLVDDFAKAMADGPGKYAARAVKLPPNQSFPSNAFRWNFVATGQTTSPGPAPIISPWLNEDCCVGLTFRLLPGQSRFNELSSGTAKTVMLSWPKHLNPSHKPTFGPTTGL